MTLKLARNSGIRTLPRLVRQYAIPSAQRAEEKGRIVNYLQDEDRRMLSDVSHQMQDCIDKANICMRFAQSLPTEVQSLPGIPAYTLGFQRNDVAEASAIHTRYVNRAEILKDHLDDYLVEPYPVRDELSEVDFEDEIRSWGQERLEDEAKNLEFEIAAQENRLSMSAQRLKATASKLEANTEERARVALEKEEGRRESPFAAAATQPDILEKAKRLETKPGFVQEGVVGGRSKVLPRSTTTRKPDFLKSAPRSLESLQAQLEKSLASRK